MHLRPLHDRLIVQRLDETGPRAGAIIIPDSAQEKPQQGRALAAGDVLAIQHAGAATSRGAAKKRGR